jgi:hypothetical protein
MSGACFWNERIQVVQLGSGNHSAKCQAAAAVTEGPWHGFSRIQSYNADSNPASSSGESRANRSKTAPSCHNQWTRWRFSSRSTTGLPKGFETADPQSGKGPSPCSPIVREAASAFGAKAAASAPGADQGAFEQAAARHGI